MVEVREAEADDVVHSTESNGLLVQELVKIGNYLRVLCSSYEEDQT